MDILQIIGREKALFSRDLIRLKDELARVISESSFLVIGGAGSIGQSVTKEIFRRNPKLLHVVDLNENAIAELVRDLRSSLGYIKGEFRTFCIDCGGAEYESLVSREYRYDFVLNLSALKHVRSEKDPYTLMRLIEVNVLNVLKTLHLAREQDAKKFFCVSTDKAANPVNMMGASKRIMEMFLMRESENQLISTARFANVAFSDGSLLHSFTQRFMKREPLSGPTDVKRYFVTAQESGELCLLSCIFGENRDIFFPKLIEKLHLINFQDIAIRYLKAQGFEPYFCQSEAEAREGCESFLSHKLWPCFFSASDTTGEKDVEEFFTAEEFVINERYADIGIVKNSLDFDDSILEEFITRLEFMKTSLSWEKSDLLDLFRLILPNFEHVEKYKYLDEKM